MIRIQSNGIGQQSWAMYFMSSLGTIPGFPRFNYSIFADPGREDKRSYEYLKWAQDWAKKNNGVPLVITGKKTLYRDLMKGKNSGNGRFAPIPAYTINPDGSSGILRRQCTGEYKINEFNREVRKILHLGGKNYPEIEVYNAITVDEVDRVTINEIVKFINVYPFCNLQTNSKTGTKFLNHKTLTRADCVAWLSVNGFPVPPKSACTFCPYQSDSQWLWKKQNDPREFKALVKLDKHIRESSVKGIDNPIFLHKSCKPLDEVELKEDQTQLFQECEGNCDV